MIDKEEAYVKDPERLEKLAPVMAELGVSEDGAFHPDGSLISSDTLQYLIKDCPEEAHIYVVYDRYTWHTGTLELLLPEWYRWGLGHAHDPDYLEEHLAEEEGICTEWGLEHKISKLMERIVLDDISAKANNLTDLILLLKENKIKLRGEE